MVPTSFVPSYDSAFFLIRELARGTPSATECAPAGEILSADRATPSFNQHNPSDFEQCRQVPNSRESIMPLAPAALGG
jgi:hypothetical protein